MGGSGDLSHKDELQAVLRAVRESQQRSGARMERFLLMEEVLEKLWKGEFLAWRCWVWRRSWELQGRSRVGTEGAAEELGMCVCVCAHAHVCTSMHNDIGWINEAM